jgi:hypothetical protein
VIQASLPCAALSEGKRLKVRYNGFTRIVEVHAVGRSRENHSLMRVWQVRGGSISEEPIGWKLMRLDHATDGVVTDEVSDAPRPEYKRGDSAMLGGILRQL